MRFLLPFYHTVTDNDLPHLCHLYQPKNVAEFKRDLHYLGKRYHFVDLNTFKQAAKNGFKNNAKKICHLSFDDGLAECSTIVAPILKQHGIPATFFINSAFIDNHAMLFRMKASLLIDKCVKHPLQKKMRNEFLKLSGIKAEADLKTMLLNVQYHDKERLGKLAELVELDFDDYLQTHKPYMSWHQLKALHLDGFSIGAHSHDHPEFRLLTLDEQLAQVQQCTNAIKTHLGLNTIAFSFPFTDHGVPMSFFEQLHKTSSIEITFGTAGMKQDKAHANFQRVAMETGRSANYTVSKAKLKSFVRQRLGLNSINRF